MRKLIRPALFWAARIGLGVAVVAAIAGQWQEIHGGFHIPNGCINFVCSQRGWSSWLTRPLVSSGDSSTDSSDFLYVETQRHSKRDYFAGEFGDPDSDWFVATRGHSFTYILNSPAITISHSVTPYFGVSPLIIAIRHWLIITVFAMFYGALKRVYRNRPEVADG